MTHYPIDYLKASLAIGLSLALAVIVGSFIGTPVNPKHSRELQAKIDNAMQTGMVFRDGEAEAYLAVPSEPAPPFLIAVLDWHAWLIAPGLILALLILRPAVIPAFVTACAATAALYHFVAPTPALVLLVSAVIGMFVTYALRKAAPNATQGAA